jgi:hypothetical protein
MPPLSLFAVWPLPGCRVPVDDPREPCEDCKTAFGSMLRQGEQHTGAAEYAAELAGRDAAAQGALVARHGAGVVPEPAIEWRSNQLCWLCDQRRKCRADPDHEGRWICRECAAGG